jgi:hypothetical protein
MSCRPLDRPGGLSSAWRLCRCYRPLLIYKVPYPVHHASLFNRHHLETPDYEKISKSAHFGFFGTLAVWWAFLKYVRVHGVPFPRVVVLGLCCFVEKQSLFHFSYFLHQTQIVAIHFLNLLRLRLKSLSEVLPGDT